MYNSTVSLVRVVYIDDNGGVCMCDSKFSKTCFYRVINCLECRECSVMVTPIAEEEIVNRIVVSPTGKVSCSDSLRSVVNHIKKVRS